MWKIRKNMKTIVLGLGKSPCTKKKLSEESAIAIVMQRCYTVHKNGKNEKNYYYCKECDAFHTTSL